MTHVAFACSRAWLTHRLVARPKGLDENRVQPDRWLIILIAAAVALLSVVMAASMFFAAPAR